MFNNLLNFWRGKDFLTQVIGDFAGMLDHAEHMFRIVSEALLENKQPEGLKDEVYQVDKKINRLERGIRQRIVEHMTLQPTIDTSSCLCLMSVIKDAERLGDYTKNLYEVIELLAGPINRGTYDQYFDDIAADILTLYQETKEAFVKDDRSKAKSSFALQNKLVKECDAILSKLATSDLSTNEGVCYALIARYYKRVAAHLVNISTSVVLPITELDYFDEEKAAQTDD